MIAVCYSYGMRGLAMDLSSLGSLGKVAGVGGIAIGAVVLLVRPHGVLEPPADEGRISV